MSLRTACKSLYLASATALALGLFLLNPQPAHAVAGSYQQACQPYVVSGYNFGQWASNMNGYHVGQDIGCSTGTPEYAVADGQVVYSARTPDSWRWGNLVMIQHVNPDGSQVTSIYGHLADNRQVSAGQMVAKGQLLGFVGPAWTAQNGNWGDHLHIGMHVGPYGAAIGSYDPRIHGYEPSALIGTYVNPGDYIASHQVTYDYQVVGMSGSGSHGKNEQFGVDMTLRNTGSGVWRAGGANPFRIGTVSPNDRSSGFSAGMGGQGWMTPTRLAIPNDVAPGQTVTIHATFNDALVPPGNYAESFAPVIEGQTWFAYKGLTFNLNVRPPVLGAAWVTQGSYRDLSANTLGNATSTSYLVPGQKMNMKVLVRNSGDVPWSAGGSNPIRLGTTRGNDRGSGFATLNDGSIPASENWLSPSRASGLDGRYDEGARSVVAADSIAPGQVAVFSFTIVAPSQPGTYNEYFNPVMEGVTWFGDLGIYFPLRVLSPGNHYEYAGQHNPAPVNLTGSTTAEVDLRNAGQTPWPVGGDFRLGTDRARDHQSDFQAGDWVNNIRPSNIDGNLSVPGKTTVDAGEVAKFSFTVSDRNRPDGTYAEYLRPLVENVTWLPEDYGIYVPVTVQSPPLKQQILSQTTDRSIANLRYGDTATVTLAIRNVGSQAWNATGADQVLLGTSRPTDRGSGFAVLTGTDPWLSPNRASAIDGKATSLSPLVTAPATTIAQGETAVFKVPVHVPNGLNPGAYNEYFNLVKEGVSWFDDLGLYFPLYVTGA